MRLKRPNWSWRRVFWFTAAVLGGYLAICFLLSSTYLSPTRTVPSLPEGLREVQVPTQQGENPAWATPALADGKGSEIVFVLAHGYGGTRAGWSELMEKLDQRGYDSVAPAMPGQDASPQATVGFGVAEAKVLASTVQWVRSTSKSQPKIVLLGVSMGGASAWLASQIVDVDGVVTEGAYATFDEAVTHWFGRLVPGGQFTFRPVIWIASARSGIKPGSIRPIEAALAWRGKPALVIQAEHDNLILRHHADRLAQAAGCELWIVPNAEHANCYPAAPEEYVDRLVTFAQRL